MWSVLSFRSGHKSEGGSEFLTSPLLTDAGFVALAPLHPEVHALGDGLEAAGVTRRVLEGSYNNNNIYNNQSYYYLEGGQDGAQLAASLGLVRHVRDYHPLLTHL